MHTHVSDIFFHVQTLKAAKILAQRILAHMFGNVLLFSASSGCTLLKHSRKQAHVFCNM